MLGKCGFTSIGAGLQGAPARGGLVECHELSPCPGGLDRRGRPWPKQGASRTRARAVTGRAMKFLEPGAQLFARATAGRARSRSGVRIYRVFGGPDGGDGGRGGDVVIECADGLNTLIDFRYQQHFKAKTGMHGMGRNRAGGAARRPS